MFSDHVTQLHKDGDNLFSKEYEEIQKYSRKIAKGFSHEHSANPENKCKNRYLNIVACKIVSFNMLEIKHELDYNFCFHDS